MGEAEFPITFTQDCGFTVLCWKLKKLIEHREKKMACAVSSEEPFIKPRI